MIKLIHTNRILLFLRSRSQAQRLLYTISILSFIVITWYFLVERKQALHRESLTEQSAHLQKRYLALEHLLEATQQKSGDTPLQQHKLTSYQLIEYIANQGLSCTKFVHQEHHNTQIIDICGSFDTLWRVVTQLSICDLENLQSASLEQINDTMKLTLNFTGPSLASTA